MECKNCSSPLPIDAHYCARCGNRVLTKRLTVKNVVHEFSKQFFDMDNKIFKTFIHLLTKPEVVINKFIEGSRKTYVNVISYLALSLTLIGFQLLILRNFYPETIESSTTSGGLDPEVEKRIAEMGEYIFDYFSLITIIFIPFIALATYIIFRKRTYNYAEHIVFNMYASAQYNIMLFFISSPLIFVGLDAATTFSIVTVIIYIYIGFCMKRVFKLTVFGAFWRTILSQILYAIIVGIITIILTILGVIIYKLINS
jgi:hypothetical protein